MIIQAKDQKWDFSEDDNKIISKPNAKIIMERKQRFSLTASSTDVESSSRYDSVTPSKQVSNLLENSLEENYSCDIKEEDKVIIQSCEKDEINNEETGIIDHRTRKKKIYIEEVDKPDEIKELIKLKNSIEIPDNVEVTENEDNNTFVRKDIEESNYEHSDKTINERSKLDLFEGKKTIISKPNVNVIRERK
jgi:hypothetical protein